MASVVLAGGRGFRLGRENALEKLGKETLLERVINCLSLLGDKILIVIAQGQSYPPLSPAEIVVDLYPDKGALGGIYTGLSASKSPYSLVVACDMPFLNLALLRYLIGLSPNFDAVVPRVKGEVEPLHAVYSRNCLVPIQKQIEQGNLKIRDFLSQVRVRYVEEEEINRFDPQHLSFFNINTQADLKRAKALLRD